MFLRNGFAKASSGCRTDTVAAVIQIRIYSIFRQKVILQEKDSEKNIITDWNLITSEVNVSDNICWYYTRMKRISRHKRSFFLIVINSELELLSYINGYIHKGNN